MVKSILEYPYDKIRLYYLSSNISQITPKLTIFSHNLCGQELRSSLTGWFCLTIHHEVQVRMLAWGVVIRRLAWVWRFCFQGSSSRCLGRQCCLLAGGLDSLPPGPPHKTGVSSHDMAAGFSPSE